MLFFGVVLTGVLWTYWYYHTAPFSDLQRAIGTEFKHSSPRVDGGQRRKHLGGTRLLWVIMRVPYLPESDPERSQKTADRVVELVRLHAQVSDFDQVNVRLFYGEPERVLHKRDFEVVLNSSQ
jgi:hypothetical protein